MPPVASTLAVPLAVPQVALVAVAVAVGASESLTLAVAVAVQPLASRNYHWALVFSRTQASIAASCQSRQCLTSLAAF